MLGRCLPIIFIHSSCSVCDIQARFVFFLYDADRSYVRIALGWILANAPIYMISKCSINVEILDTNNSKVFSKFRFVRLLFGDNRENPCLTREYDTIRSEEAART